MNLIFQTIYDYWCRAKHKTSPSGWISRNCPFCEHRGQSPDKRGRGGLKFDDNTLSLNCFNCGYTCSFTIGRPIYPKMINAMLWLGIDEKTINQLKLESLRAAKEAGYEPKKIVRRDVKAIDLPKNCILLETDISNHKAHVNFLKTRGFEPSDFPFLVSPDIVYRSRVIIPFILHDTIIGYSARSINPIKKMRYIMKTTTDFVFGMDWVEPEHEWVFVTEGLLDSLSVKCLAVMHNEISNVQIEMIEDLQKKIIVVPDLDKAGLAKSGNSLIDTAIDNGWSVSIPQWKEKDINAAYVKYGPLFCITHLLKNANNNALTIKLQQKLLLNDIKKKIF